MNGHPTERELLEFEGLDSRRRAELLPHLVGCARCRGRWAAEDPSRLFAVLGLRSCDERALEGLSTSVGRRIELETARRKPGRFHAVASIAASLLLAALLGGLLWNGDAVKRPVEPVAAAAAAGAADARWSGVELVDSPGEARVVDLTIGETRVVMIFDEALDL